MTRLRKIAKKHVGKILRHEDRKLSKATKSYLIRKSNLCALCGKEILTMKDATIDHIVPLSKGGVHGINNMQLAHSECNALKGNQLTSKQS